MLLTIPYAVDHIICCSPHHMLFTIPYAVYHTICCLPYQCCSPYHMLFTIPYAVYHTICCSPYHMLFTIQNLNILHVVLFYFGSFRVQFRVYGKSVVSFTPCLSGSTHISLPYVCYLNCRFYF